MGFLRRTGGDFLRSCLAVLLLIASGAAAHGFETGYWAWQRNESLSPAEVEELRTQGVRAIYWQVGELAQSGAAWRWNGRFALPASTPEMRYLPVVRLESRERTPFSADANASLLAALSPALRNAEELQIDYDAPDRLLADYAAMLKQLRKLVPRVTITALPHWAQPSTVRELRGAADEFLVMLYDFE